MNNKVIFFDSKLSNNNKYKTVKKPYILQVIKSNNGYVIKKKYIDSDCKKSNIILI